MRKTMKFILLVVLVPLVAVPFVTAAEVAPEEQTIVEVAVGDSRFETLVAAVVAAGLDDELSAGEWTVFAPTDAAFAKLELNEDNIAGAFSAEELADILLYHVIDEEFSSQKAKANTGDIVMANGHLAGLKYYDGDLYVNDDSKVIDADITASNGVIHAVDTVILGPWPREADEEADEEDGAAPSGNIVEIAAGDTRFETLVAAVVAAGLDDELSGGEWTVFAPTDAAFAKLELNEDNIAGAFSAEELADILLYHVIDEEFSSQKAKANTGDIVMANGHLAGLKYYDGDLYVNDDSKVIDADITASNGVIHAVDTVILGPWPRE